MKTYPIAREEIKDLPVLAEGYKAIKWDSSTKGNSAFHYGSEGEVLVGTVWEVDDNISKCNWGLHFSKNPAHVFRFYEPLGYNRYFKVKAYKEIKENETEKTVARTIEFVEEYDLMEFIEIIKKYDYNSKAVNGSNAVSGSEAVNGSYAVNWSEAVNGSYAVNWSNAVSGSKAVNGSYAVNGSKAVNGSYAVNWSNAVSGSEAVNGSYAVNWSNAVSGSEAVNDSEAVSGSEAVSNCYAVSQCKAVINCVFCFKKEVTKNCIFNKQVSESRFNKVFDKIKSFNWFPQYLTWDEAKGNKDWWAFNFEKLRESENPWAGMPDKMLQYITSMPEFDRKVFQEITGIVSEGTE